MRLKRKTVEMEEKLQKIRSMNIHLNEIVSVFKTSSFYCIVTKTTFLQLI